MYNGNGNGLETYGINKDQCMTNDNLYAHQKVSFVHRLHQCSVRIQDYHPNVVDATANVDIIFNTKMEN